MPLSFEKTQSPAGASAIGESPRGLSETEAQARLVAEGPNELPRSNRRTPSRIAFEVIREPMLALLLGGGMVYLLLPCGTVLRKSSTTTWSSRGGALAAAELSVACSQSKVKPACTAQSGRR
ncbi:cation-transporting P-type ATPase [Mesorhizobium sp. ESP7-2]|uniref:cation-transporting P-type ATPase n=1 Tax=Mesorhizobium sp. ESP7-2 TaxID=2876622 RepID=UPI00398C5EB3